MEEVDAVTYAPRAITGNSSPGRRILKPSNASDQHHKRTQKDLDRSTSPI